MDESHADRLPKWLKKKIPKGNSDHLTARIVSTYNLPTVCDHAKCPNRMECYAEKTATFMVLGSVCTRNCRFCAVTSGIPQPPDKEEPQKLAQAVKELGLSHAVLTMVTRDDLADGGAAHFVKCVEEIRKISPATIEVLPSDFAGNMDAVDLLSDALPDVYGYNSETVARLYDSVRGPLPNYRRTLDIFRQIHKRQPEIILKSGIILGLGENKDDLLEFFADLIETGCQAITIGQYLQPSVEQMPVQRYYTPEEFEQIGQWAKQVGFEHVASGPFVRSSYHAKDVIQIRHARHM